MYLQSMIVPFGYTDYHSYFFFNDTATTEIYTLSLHDALPISLADARHDRPRAALGARPRLRPRHRPRRRLLPRSEEHTSELQSQFHLVCRLLLEKKKKTQTTNCQPQITSFSNTQEHTTKNAYD